MSEAAEGPMVEALRILRAALAGQDIPAQDPAIAPDVIAALAALAADIAIGVLTAKGFPQAEARVLSRRAVEDRLAGVMLGEGTAFDPSYSPLAPDSPPGKPAQFGGSARYDAYRLARDAVAGRPTALPGATEEHLARMAIACSLLAVSAMLDAAAARGLDGDEARAEVLASLEERMAAAAAGE